MREVVCLFSGGADSTLSAALVAKKYDRVRLLTYDRFGFFKTKENPSINFERLKKRFGKDRFTFEVIKYDEFFKKIQYDNYQHYLKRYGALNMSICGLCKLAMHWRTIIYCKDNEIKDVCCGAVKEMSVFPEQNREIALNNIEELYSSFGINYFSPVYDEGKKVEKTLFDYKIIDSCNHKLTKNDKQVICSQQVLFAKFVQYYLSENDWGTYVNNMKKFYQEKLDYIKEQVENGLLH